MDVINWSVKETNTIEIFQNRVCTMGYIHIYIYVFKFTLELYDTDVVERVFNNSVPIRPNIQSPPAAYVCSMA